MVDYDKSSGLGTLRIRDLGSNIEFWVKPYYSDFWWQNLHFTTTTTASTNNHYIDLDGNAWVKVTTRTVTTSQTVTFKLVTATGTQSLGGPTTHSVSINRSTKPPRPDAPTFANVKNTSLRASFTHNGNGGASLTNWAIALSTGSSPGATYYPGSDQWMDITGLVAGTKYNFWSRVANVNGWSDWSPSSSVTMHNVPDPPTGLKFTDVKQASLKLAFTPGSNRGATILEHQIGYGSSPTASQFTVVGSSGGTIINANLVPGISQYFWVRSRNTYGWGNWSARATQLMRAGALIPVGGVYKRAVPYMKVNGVWTLVEPWVRDMGVWKAVE